MRSRVAICFLVINKMEALPEIAISSAYMRTKADIFLGYLDETDLPVLDSSIVVNLLHLNQEIGNFIVEPTRTYAEFSEDSFYKIVQYKWQLLRKLLALDYDYVIYSDTDVYWNLNPLPEISTVFDFRPEVHIQIQSFTDFPSQPQLCMGFVAFRNSGSSRAFIENCQSRHTSFSRDFGRIGDDDIVTQYYTDNNFPGSILELPQTTFPVGRMLKLYSKWSKFPGLPSPVPFIFHANYVVGLRNKLILMRIFMRHYSISDKKMKIKIQFIIILQLQRMRLLISRTRKFLAD